MVLTCGASFAAAVPASPAQAWSASAAAPSQVRPSWNGCACSNRVSPVVVCSRRQSERARCNSISLVSHYSPVFPRSIPSNQFLWSLRVRPAAAQSSSLETQLRSVAAERCVLVPRLFPLWLLIAASREPLLKSLLAGSCILVFAGIACRSSWKSSPVAPRTNPLSLSGSCSVASGISFECADVDRSCRGLNVALKAQSRLLGHSVPSSPLVRSVQPAPSRCELNPDHVVCWLSSCLTHTGVPARRVPAPRTPLQRVRLAQRSPHQVRPCSFSSLSWPLQPACRC